MKRTHWKSVALDPVSVDGVSNVVDSNLLSVRSDVGVGTSHSAESVSNSGVGLAGMRVAEGGLTQLVLSVVLRLCGDWNGGNESRGRGCGHWGRVGQLGGWGGGGVGHLRS